MTIKYKCLYEITGRIEDVNTFIVPLQDLPKQEQVEPAAWKVSPRYEDCDGYFDFTETEETALTLEKRGWSIQPLYTTPQPKREPLTVEQIDEIYFKSDLEIDRQYNQLYAFARAIEAAHNIKE